VKADNVTEVTKAQRATEV